MSQLPTSFLFWSILSCSDTPARFAASLAFSASNLAFFSSSVNGAMASVDWEKLVCSVLVAWKLASSELRNFLPQSSQTRLRGTGSAAADAESAAVFAESA